MLRSLNSKNLADFSLLVCRRNRLNRLKPVFSGLKPVFSGFQRNVAAAASSSSAAAASGGPKIVFERISKVTDPTVVLEQLRSLDNVVSLENKAATASTISRPHRSKGSALSASGVDQKITTEPSSNATARKKFTPDDNYAFVKRIIIGHAHRNDTTINIPAHILVNCVKSASLLNDSQTFLDMFDKWWAMLYDRLHECNSRNIIALLSYLGHVNRETDGGVRRVLHRWHLQALETQFLVTETKDPMDFDKRYAQMLRAFKNLFTPKDYFSLNGFPSKQIIAHVIRSFKECPASSPTSTTYRRNLATIMRFMSLLKSYPKVDDVIFLTNHFRVFFDTLFPVDSAQKLRNVLELEAARVKRRLADDSVSVVTANDEQPIESRDQSSIFADQSESEADQDIIDVEELEEADLSIIDDKPRPPLAVVSSDSAIHANENSTKSRDHDNLGAFLLVEQMSQSEFCQLVVTYARFAQAFVTWRIDPDHVTPPGLWRTWFNGVECLLLMHKIRDHSDWPATMNSNDYGSYINSKTPMQTKNALSHEMVKLIVACMEVVGNFDRGSEFSTLISLCVDRLQKLAPRMNDENGARLFEAIQLCESSIKGRAVSASVSNVVEKSATTFVEPSNHFIRNTSLLSIIASKAERYYATNVTCGGMLFKVTRPATNKTGSQSESTVVSTIDLSSQSESSTVLKSQSENSATTNHKNTTGTTAESSIKRGGQEFFDSAATPDNERTWSVTDLAKQAKLYD